MAEYIEFGTKKQRVWILNKNYTEAVDDALELRGHQYVQRSLPASSYTEGAEDVWAEARNLFAQDDNLFELPKVHVAFVSGSQDNTFKNPVFASLDPDAVEKAVEAMRFAAPTTNLTVEQLSVPD